WTGWESLGVKESERDAVLMRMMESCGGRITRHDGHWHQEGIFQKPEEELDTAEDHRMVMAFCLLAMSGHPVSLSEIDSVKKSFPDFWEQIKKCGITPSSI
ncbi:MAG: hypothetical protein LPK45_00175, partial [Bacteroidota bacterium]|nr:hypothetical protein [Bacteroidota bacterium]MDX5429438.1 hypothetical protein [Bacteroidota bacterium]MDX5468227.1 hypothetical protein [Bacteroidota bacterium]